MINLIKTLQNSFHDIINYFEDGIGAFIGALAKSIADNGGKILTNAAINAVRAAEENGGTGKEKMEAAFASVVATLTAEGIPVVTYAIRGAIEAAVAQIRNEDA